MPKVDIIVTGIEFSSKSQFFNSWTLMFFNTIEVDMNGFIAGSKYDVFVMYKILSVKTNDSIFYNECLLHKNE